MWVEKRNWKLLIIFDSHKMPFHDNYWVYQLWKITDFMKTSTINVISSKDNSNCGQVSLVVESGLYLKASLRRSLPIMWMPINDCACWFPKQRRSITKSLTLNFWNCSSNNGDNQGNVNHYCGSRQLYQTWPKKLMFLLWFSIMRNPVQCAHASQIHHHLTNLWWVLGYQDIMWTCKSVAYWDASVNDHRWSVIVRNIIWT